MKTLKLEAVRVESFPTQGVPEQEDGLFGSISYCQPCFFTQQWDCTREGC